METQVVKRSVKCNIIANIGKNVTNAIWLSQACATKPQFSFMLSSNVKYWLLNRMVYLFQFWLIENNIKILHCQKINLIDYFNMFIVYFYGKSAFDKK